MHNAMLAKYMLCVSICPSDSSWYYI